MSYSIKFAADFNICGSTVWGLMEIRLELFQEVGNFDQLLRFLLLAKALISLNAYFRTVFSVLNGKGVHLMGQHYPCSLVKVSIFKWGLNISVSV
jgi:hypothetical protein